MMIFLALLALTLPIGIALFTQNPAYGFLMLVSIFGAMVLFNFGSVKVFSILGLKAELESKIREAEVTLKQLKDISMATSRATLAELISSMFIGGIKINERLKLRKTILESLNSINLTEDEIRAVETEWREGCSYLFFSTIRTMIMKLDREAGKEAKSLMLSDALWHFTPTSSAIKAIVDKYSLEDSALMSLLNDYKHFETTGEINNPTHLDCGAREI